MKFSFAFTLRVSALEDRDVQTVDPIFHAIAASYNFSFPSDGELHSTNYPAGIAQVVGGPSQPVTAVKRWGPVCPFTATVISMDRAWTVVALGTVRQTSAGSGLFRTQLKLE